MNKPNMIKMEVVNFKKEADKVGNFQIEYEEEEKEEKRVKTIGR